MGQGLGRPHGQVHQDLQDPLGANQRPRALRVRPRQVRRAHRVDRHVHRGAGGRLRGRVQPGRGDAHELHLPLPDHRPQHELHLASIR